MREEENKQPSRGSNSKNYFKKRWVFPAIYIGSAALILTGVLWYQNSSTDNAVDSDKYGYESNVPGDHYKDKAVEVNRSMENVILPLNTKDRDSMVIQKKFYDDNADAKEQEAALVVHQNQYYPNTGIDVTVKGSESFDVVASLSGTVTKVEEDSLLGNVIEIKHDNDVVTHYSSINNMKVAVGDEVEQGQAIATAGKSLLNEEAGVHVHFEIRKDGVPVNPESFLNKPMSDIESAMKEESSDQENATGDNGVTEEGNTQQTPANDTSDMQKEKSPATDESNAEKEGTPTNEGSSTEQKPADDQTTDQKQDEQTNSNQNGNA